MRFVYLTTSGSADPTKASIPIHLAVNGSLENGDSVDIVLAGDATDLVVGGIAGDVEGVGVPPLRELLAKAREHEVPIWV